MVRYLIFLVILSSCYPDKKLRKITTYRCKQNSLTQTGSYFAVDKFNKGYVEELFIYKNGFCTAPNICSDSIKTFYNHNENPKYIHPKLYSNYSSWAFYQIFGDSILIQYVTYFTSPAIGDFNQVKGLLRNDSIFLDRGIGKDGKKITSAYFKRLVKFRPDSSANPYLRPTIQKQLRKIHCKL